MQMQNAIANANANANGSDGDAKRLLPAEADVDTRLHILTTLRHSYVSDYRLLAPRWWYHEQIKILIGARQQDNKM